MSDHTSARAIFRGSSQLLAGRVASDVNTEPRALTFTCNSHAAIKAIDWCVVGGTHVTRPSHAAIGFELIFRV